jgi:tyrosinase
MRHTGDCRHDHDRRSFLKLGATLGATALFSRGRAQAQATSVRPAIDSAAGARMLDLYARAIKRMQDPAINIPPQPQSWTFQAHIHGVPQNPFHPMESNGLFNGTPELKTRIDLIYGNPAAGTPRAAWKAAALKCWGTCPHFSPWFVAWHRWYILFFEKIIRQMSGATDFALPYWNYASNDGSSLQLPAPFQNPTVGDTEVPNPLYEDLRGLGFASGAGTGDQNVPMNNGGFMPFSQTDYDPALGAKPLFPSDDTYIPCCKPGYLAFGLAGRLEIQPHDNVHDNVGGLMSNIPVAALDPIFYVHHCQIDRLWAAWQAQPGSVFNWGTTPTDPSEKEWGSRPFSFVGEGGKVVTVTAAGQLSTKRLGYEYDNLPTAKSPVVVAAAPAPPAGTVVPSRASGLSVGSGGARTTLAPAPGVAAPPAAATKGPTLVLRDVRLISRPPAPLHVFLNLPEGGAPSLNSPYHVGMLNFFNWDTGTGRPMADMPGPGGSRHAMAKTGEFRFEVGDQLAQQRASNLWNGGPVTVTISTLGADRSRGRTYVRIGQVDLVP